MRSKGGGCVLWLKKEKSFLSGQLIKSIFKMSRDVDCRRNSNSRIVRACLCIMLCRRNSNAEIDKPAVLGISCYHDFLLIKHTKPNRKRTISKTTVSATEARKPSKCVYKVKWRKFCEHSGREWRVLYI